MKQAKRFVLLFAGIALLATIWLGGRHLLGQSGRMVSLKTFLAEVAGALSPTYDEVAPNTVPFDYVEIDDNAGDVKLVGDIDGDTYPDLVLGGMPGEKLNWYHYPTWQKTVIATPNNEFTTDGRLGDVDGDGDLDIVVPDGDGTDNLVWLENPRPSGDPFNGNEWTRHDVGTIGSWGKDVHLSDFDNNGLMDIATRDYDTVMVFFQTTANVWSKMNLSGLNTGTEGMSSGDVDGDSHVDLILRGQWVRNPGGVAAQTASNWIPYNIGTADTDFKALVADVDKDGHMDVLFSSSENTADVNWWSADNGNPTGTWTKHTIVANLERCHTLQVADIDRDGDMDVVLGQMHTSAAQEIMVMFNTDGQATSWAKQVVATGGLHNGVVADIGNDGDYDIYGANWTGNPPARLWLNQLNPPSGILPIDQWTYKEVTDSHAQTFGLAFGDVNDDGRKDIISGVYWYQNPGGDLLGDWTQNDFPADMHSILVTDVDGDMLIDVIAQKQESSLSLYWLEPMDTTGQAWNSVMIGEVDTASHPLGAQGYRTAQIEAGGKDEVIISSGNGIYYFRVPANPEAGNWPRVQVSGDPSDEGFAVGDIDRDGELDIAATTGDAKGVVWYKNPGTGASDWTGYQIGDFADALYPDRTEVADLNGNGRLDIIVTEENGTDSDAQTYWWEQPADATMLNWTQHLITTQATTNSLDIADMNNDGDVDVILAEHRGSKKLSIWANSGDGSFIEQIVSTGHESHLGGQTVDLDSDGDLDIVSIAYDDFNLVHLWRNDAPPASSASSLYVVKNGDGSGDVVSDPAGIDCGFICSVTVSSGTVMTLTATPDTFSNFAGWSGDCAGTGDCIVAVNTAKNVTATFTLNSYNLNVTIAGDGTGSISSDPSGINCPGDCNEAYDYGTVVTLTANYDADNSALVWGGVCASASSSSCVVTVNQMSEVTATFTLNQYSLGVALSGNGSGSVVSDPTGIACQTGSGQCTAAFDHGTAVTLTATANIGSFTGWTGDCSGTGDCVVTMDAAQNVTATFQIQEAGYLLYLPLIAKEP